MFAGEPPSSSDPTKRSFRRISSDLEAFRRLLLQIGGANIAGADRAFATAAFLAHSQPAATAEVGLFRRLAARSFVQASGARDPGGKQTALTLGQRSWSSRVFEDLADHLSGPAQQIDVLQRLAGVSEARGAWQEHRASSVLDHAARIEPLQPQHP
jgi:hypothetical protein